MSKIRRRDFIAAAAGAAAWPLAAQAQQRNMPVIGVLDASAESTDVKDIAAFRKGLSETGFVEGRNVTIEFRYGNGLNDRLREFAADYVRRRVAVIFAMGLQAALPAKAATATLPIVFQTNANPVQYGLVTSFNRPGGNVTGIGDLGFDLGAKRLGLLHEMLPEASRFAILVDPTSVATESEIAEVRAAAAALGRPIEVVTASNNDEIDTAFADLVQKHIEALLVPPNTLFNIRSMQLAALAMYHHLPAVYGEREYVEIGGLMSYGPLSTEKYRQAGIYVGRILKGEKPDDLPVMRPSKFEFVINLHTARTLGIEVPRTLLAIADEVIE